MIKFIHFIIFFVCSFGLVAQNVNPAVGKILQTADSIYFSNPDSSFKLSAKAETMLTDSNDLKLLAQSKVFKGRYLLLKSNLEEADIELNGAYNLFKEITDTSGMARVLKLKSILQERLGNQSEAIFLLEESISLNKKSKDFKSAISGLTNLMRRYTMMKDYYKVEVVIKEVEGLEQYMDQTGRYFFIQNKGIFYLEKKNYKQSLLHLEQAKEIAFQNKMLDSQATILMLLAKANRLNGDVAKAIGYLKESEKICIENNFENEMLDNYIEYVECYREQGNYKEAFKCQTYKDSLSERLVNIDKINKIAALEKKVALTEKQKEIDIEKINTEEEKSKSRMLIYFLAFVGLLLILVVFLFFRARNLKNKIQEKSILVEVKQREIIDSIHYAKRIQSALLTPESYLRKYLNDFFILYKPKDIVSGDFYWALEHDGKFYFSLADCTGHGVPGAFVSMIGINYLSKIISEQKQTSTAVILDLLKEEVIKSLNNEDTLEATRDGMDMILVKMDIQTGEIEFAGANNSIYIHKAGSRELIEYKGDKMPVGMHSGQAALFNSVNLKLEKGDMIYAFTDGYPDQFGGPKGKKFKYKQLEDLILKNAHLPLLSQKAVLEMNFEEWRGKLEQIDDVCVIGIRF